MKITKLKTNRFKTNLYALFLTVPLERTTVTKNALLASVLRRGTKNLNTQEKISKKLEEMYGAGFNCGVDKIGNYHTLKFYLETIDNIYTLSDENLLQEGINLLLDIALNPLVDNESFKKEYVEQEKENLKKMLLSKKDNKSLYAKDRCIEEMFEGEPYSLYKYGYIEDIDKIDAKSLYEYYKELINKCRIDLFLSGENIEDIKIPKVESKEIEKINIKHMPHTTEKKVRESLDVVQGKLMIGLNVPDEDKPAVSVYNTILGGGANSKLFQNVREKASLAYTAGSSYVRRQNFILIQTGIEIENYEKALKIIKEQLEEMKKGNITTKEFEAAKRLITASVNLIPESQEDMIAYYFDQKLSEEDINITEYCNMLQKVKIEDVIKVANKVSIDTIYFLDSNLDSKEAE